MCKLAGAVAARTNVPKSVAVGALFGHLSIALQRANARAIQRRWGWRLAGVPTTTSAALVAEPWRLSYNAPQPYGGPDSSRGP